MIEVSVVVCFPIRNFTIMSMNVHNYAVDQLGIRCGNAGCASVDYSEYYS